MRGVSPSGLLNFILFFLLIRIAEIRPEGHLVLHVGRASPEVVDTFVGMPLALPAVRARMAILTKSTKQNSVIMGPLNWQDFRAASQIKQSREMACRDVATKPRLWKVEHRNLAVNIGYRDIDGISYGLSCFISGIYPRPFRFLSLPRRTRCLTKSRPTVNTGAGS